MDVTGFNAKLCCNWYHNVCQGLLNTDKVNEFACISCDDWPSDKAHADQIYIVFCRSYSQLLCHLGPTLAVTFFEHSDSTDRPTGINCCTVFYMFHLVLFSY